MITALVQFALTRPLTLEEARTIFSGTAPKYRDVKGLIRKYYILSEDGRTAGGVYLWESRNHAETMYDETWRSFVLEKYGSTPTVTYFESPVVVDNPSGSITVDP
jgi:hypothetical protein